MPELTMDLDAAALHPKAVTNNHIGQERVIDNSYVDGSRSRSCLVLSLPPGCESGDHANNHKERIFAN
jgi:hypothetical protein